MTKRMVWMLGMLMVAGNAQAAKRALIYNGPGACTDGCYAAAFQVALEAGFDPVYVNEKALDSHSDAQAAKNLFQDAAVWIQPGGKSKISMTSITSQLKTAIQEFVSAGGGYVGFCAGAFSSTYKVGTTSTLGFNFMPGQTTVYPTKKTADIIPLNWQGKIRQVYWEGGPYLSSIPDGKAEVIATYPNGTIASARSLYGQGKVFVTGAHPEAPQDWRDYYHLHDSDGLDKDLAVDMIHWVTSGK